MVFHGGDKRDECLFYFGESYDMEICYVVEELFQRFMDYEQFEVFIGGREELQICMQSEEKKVFLIFKVLVICFIRKGIGFISIYSQAAFKLTLFVY